MSETAAPGPDLLPRTDDNALSTIAKDDANRGQDDSSNGSTPISPWQSSRSRPLTAMNLDDFLTAPVVPREPFLGPLLCRQGLAMVHAKRGVGKTYFSIAVGLAVASGSSFLDWCVPEARRVLYIDGEMPAALMQSRMKEYLTGAGARPDTGYFRMLSADHLDIPALNLSTMAGQEAVAKEVKAANLLIIDNLATLSRHGKENDTESWHPMQDWLLQLRRQGKAVLLVHHSSKGGTQRGTSGREDALDTVVNLRHPNDYEPQQGARFIVQFEKARGSVGSQLEPFEAVYTVRDGAGHWTTKTLEASVEADVVELKAGGMSYRDIAEKLGISKSAAQRAHQRRQDSYD